jgi:hypothetical protein
VEDSEALVEVYSRLAESFERFWVDIYLFVKFESVQGFKKLAPGAAALVKRLKEGRKEGRDLQLWEMEVKLGSVEGCWELEHLGK